ncbi:hypothetical protein [Paenibacillus soyae]|uniref:Uncharacterized protein n=1 Tax=Paenibacillus soyae TaxID=2969249 RepID=A0A9X2MN53_9BACL|nr:hypothetical protein [Paenibacillus soyae]MCR2803132.1 hypothetical protein [Paenibacillus soyae]
MFNRGKRAGKWNAAAVIVLVLFVIGLIVGLRDNLLQLLLPIVILGGIFLLYKYPPSFLGGARGGRKHAHVTQSRPSATKPKSSRPRSKNVPFRVIEGGKDDDDLPKYH